MINKQVILGNEKTKINIYLNDEGFGYKITGDWVESDRVLKYFYHKAKESDFLRFAGLIKYRYNLEVLKNKGFY